MRRSLNVHCLTSALRYVRQGDQKQEHWEGRNESTYCPELPGATSAVLRCDARQLKVEIYGDTIGIIRLNVVMSVRFLGR